MRKIVRTIAVVVVLEGLYLYLLVLCPALNPFYLVVAVRNHVRGLRLYAVNTVISDYFEETGRMPEDLTQLFGFLETRHPNDKRLTLKEWAKKNAEYKTNGTRENYFLLLIGDSPRVRENVVLCQNGDFFVRFEAFARHEFERFGKDEASPEGANPPQSASSPPRERGTESLPRGVGNASLNGR